jgi:5-formyltetrahydrofolate cyclo-ligase
VCFECQLVAAIPLLPHDILMDMVITENSVYDARMSPFKPSLPTFS